MVIVIMMNVYYLDDEPALCDIFSDLFSTDTIHIQTFTDASLAIQACSESAPDLFFIDMSLGNTTGDKVAQAVADDIVKILITGNLSGHSDNLFHTSFSKPYNMTEIQSFLSDWEASL